jgi:hypothetical protein
MRIYRWDILGMGRLAYNVLVFLYTLISPWTLHFVVVLSRRNCSLSCSPFSHGSQSDPSLLSFVALTSICACNSALRHNMSLSEFPQAATTDEKNRSGSIKFATWILLGVTVATFVARQVMKGIVFRKLALDDFFILVATVRMY